MWRVVWIQAPVWLLPVLPLWTMPFLWIGVTLTLRRCRDAGLSPWLALGFFVPYANYILMLVLSLVPGGAPLTSAKRTERAEGDRVPAALLAIVISTAAGLATVVVSVQV